MMLMAYLSYMLAEVRSVYTFLKILPRQMLFLHLMAKFLDIVTSISPAAVLFEWDSHSIFLWDCDVPLHMAQCDREF